MRGDDIALSNKAISLIDNSSLLLEGSNLKIHLSDLSGKSLNDLLNNKLAKDSVVSDTLETNAPSSIKKLTIEEVESDLYALTEKHGISLDTLKNILESIQEKESSLQISKTEITLDVKESAEENKKAESIGNNVPTVDTNDFQSQEQKFKRNLEKSQEEEGLVKKTKLDHSSALLESESEDKSNSHDRDSAESKRKRENLPFDKNKEVDTLPKKSKVELKKSDDQTIRNDLSKTEDLHIGKIDANLLKEMNEKLQPFIANRISSSPTTSESTSPKRSSSLGL